MTYLVIIVALADLCVRLVVVAIGGYIDPCTTVDGGGSLSVLLHELERRTVELVALLRRQHHLTSRTTPPTLVQVVGIDARICFNGGRIGAVHFLDNQVHSLRVAVVAKLNGMVACTRDVAAGIAVVHRHVKVVILLVVDGHRTR